MKDWESLRAPFRPWWSQRLIMALWHLNFKVYRSLPTIVSHHYTRGLIVLFFSSTVCRSCIVRYLQDRDDNKCPSCSILIHETNPFEMLRYLRSCLVCYHVVWSSSTQMLKLLVREDLKIVIVYRRSNDPYERCDKEKGEDGDRFTVLSNNGSL